MNSKNKKNYNLDGYIRTLGLFLLIPGIISLLFLPIFFYSENIGFSNAGINYMSIGVLSFYGFPLMIFSEYWLLGIIYLLTIAGLCFLAYFFHKKDKKNILEKGALWAVYVVYIWILLSQGYITGMALSSV